MASASPNSGCFHTCGAKLWSLAIPLLVFNSPKTVVLRDMRLGILLRVMQGLIIFYVLWSIIYKQSYLFDEVPLGIVEPLATGRKIDDVNSPDLFKAYEDDFWRNSSVRAGKYRYCLNSSYDFRVSESLDYSNISCVFRDKAELSYRTSGSIFVTTFFENKRVDAIAAPDAPACLPAFTAAGVNCTGNKTTYRLGRCYCSQDRYFFTVGAEELIISFNHIFYTSLKEGSLPLTRVRRTENHQMIEDLSSVPPKPPTSRQLKWEKNKDLAVIPKQTTVSFSLNQWLDYAGVNLDLPTDQTNKTLMKTGYGYSTGRYPTVRLSGVQLLMKLQYFNYNQQPGGKKKVFNMHADTECILTIEPKFLGSSMGNSINYVTQPGLGYPDSSQTREQFSYVNDIAYGVLFTFQASGVYSRFDYQSLIQALLGGAVLLKVAQVLVTFVATYALGLRSQLYREHLKENVVFEREYARFASQALTAMRVFKILDTNGNGKLDRDDLFSHLRQIDERPSDAQVWLLVDFMLKQSDALTDVYTTSDGREIKQGDGKLSLEEYIEMFTDDKTSIQDLLNMTQQLKASEEEKMMRAAEKKERAEKEAAKAARRRKKHKNFDSDGSEVLSENEASSLRERNGSPTEVIKGIKTFFAGSPGKERVETSGRGSPGPRSPKEGASSGGEAAVINIKDDKKD